MMYLPCPVAVVELMSVVFVRQSLFHMEDSRALVHYSAEDNFFNYFVNYNQ